MRKDFIYTWLVSVVVIFTALTVKDYLIQTIKCEGVLEAPRIGE